MSKNALIIDDSRSIRQMLRATLETAGFDVLEAINGYEALQLLQRPTHVDVIVTDVNMPVMDGLSFAERARKLTHTRFTPILILTTENSPEMKAQGKSAGATGWIVKPFRPELLLQVVGKVLSL